MLLRARVVLPISSPPIEDGAVAISGDKVSAVGRHADLASGPHAGPVVDLGDAILLPGLVNAHCHLDYTGMAGQFTPRRKFTDWIKEITTAKGGLIYSHFAEAWVAGSHMLIESGTTTVADTEAVPELLPEIWGGTPLRVISLLEMTGVKSRRDPASILQEVLTRLDAIPTGRNRTGLSPHAPYSTVPGLLRLSAEAARARGSLLSIHVSESAEEFEMFTGARGEMHDWLKRNERPMDDCGTGSPVAHLGRHDCLGPNLLAIHANYLAPGDADRLGRSGASVIHCPRSHAFFGHRSFPFEELRAAGVNLCLGTDSLATTTATPRTSTPPRLDLFAEMTGFANRHPGVPPSEILAMVTLNAAKALQLAGQVGEIVAGTDADLAVIPFKGGAPTAAEAAVHHSGPTLATMIAGRWVWGERTGEVLP